MFLDTQNKTFSDTFDYKNERYDTTFWIHLHQRIEEHRASAVGSHVKGCHGNSNPELLKQFSILKKCQEKLDYLIHEMLFIRERKPKLNTQSNSIRAKVIV